ncbi:hypothetical protein BT96DRAFT_1007047 [Gymnopus androsaceus JB14]|uniref:Uncharacterized protein n=1 Tax=Gymnopus androsaceus JB14 TaxID=1447944 RepID=A0A6A4GJD5_9AGAR|nr:hypothetical protein BT96DRAFT_1007047 [Gymnopus androsaceus JB14]
MSASAAAASQSRTTPPDHANDIIGNRRLKPLPTPPSVFDTYTPYPRTNAYSLPNTIGTTPSRGMGSLSTRYTALVSSERHSSSMKSYIYMPASTVSSSDTFLPSKTRVIGERAQSRATAPLEGSGSQSYAQSYSRTLSRSREPSRSLESAVARLRHSEDPYLPDGTASSGQIFKDHVRVDLPSTYVTCDDSSRDYGRYHGAMYKVERPNTSGDES